MIKILDMYIGRAIALSTLISLAVLATLSGLIRFVEQLRNLGKGSYDMADATLFVLLTVPRDIEVFFPMAVLLGGLLGLGALASNSELIVMQASGQSKLDIIKSSMKTTTVMVVLVLVIGEWVAPKFESKAIAVRSTAMSDGQVLSAQSGVWAKDGQSFVHIGKVNSDSTLSNLSIFHFNEFLRLDKIDFVDQATYQKENWQLDGINTTHFTSSQIVTNYGDSDKWISSLSPEKLGIVQTTPEALSLTDLVDYLDYLSHNEQDGSRYLLAFWRKLFQPITVAVMMLMALSFIFGPLRSTSMGARILLGVLTGFGFYLANRIFGPVALVYELPPIIGALMPSVLFTAIAVMLLRRAE